MTLSDQERKCVDLTCQYLGNTQGGTWYIEPGPTLDEQFPAEPSPEVRVTDGQKTAAIEVKRLTGDSVMNEYLESLLSLRRFLVPSCGGHYHLNPSVDFRLPVDRGFKKLLRREIEKVAPPLAVGDKAAVRILRSAPIHLVRSDGQGFIFCSHTDSGDVVRAASERITGSWFLVDDGQLEHAFVTDQGREDFCKAIAAACARVTVGGDGTVAWYEEWELWRDDNTEDGVWIICATEARDLPSAVEEVVENTLAKAITKIC